MAKRKRFKKKKVLIGSALLGTIAVMVFGIDFGDLLGAENNVQSFVQDSGDIQVYFCPHQDCNQALVNFLDSAQESIHCAMFEIDLPDVREKLLEKEQEMEVLVITDNDYLYEFNHSFVKTDTWGLMHNKFCIIDGKKISSGSMNPTVNGATKNNNNLIFIESEVLASNYEDEFQEMWSGYFKKGNMVKNPAILLGNTTILNFFCPEDKCADEVKGILETAKESIHFMTFSFTHDGIGNMLLLKHMDNITIKGVFEARGVTKYSEFKQLDYQGVDVIRDGNKANMHHKVFLIDEEIVITGSFNPTASGDKRNDENVLIIKDKDLASKFMEEFDRIWDEAKNKS